MGGDGSRPLEQSESEDWIQPAEWTIPILLHGRLAAVFLDFVLDASSRLGADRSSQIKTALATHTVGKRDAPPLARLLVVADTLHVTSRNNESEESDIGERGDNWHYRIETACAADPSLVKAYRLCIEARIEDLHQTGVTPAEETLQILVDDAGFHIGDSG